MGEIDYFNSWLFYGRSGSGKTTVSGTFPLPLLHLDINDQGTKSIKNIKGIQVRKIKDWDSFEETYWWLLKNPGTYKTIVIDTVTQLQQLAIQRLLDEAEEDKGDKVAGDWGSMSKREWGQVSSVMKIWCTNLRDLPMDVVFLAQERITESEDEDTDSGIDPSVGPRLSPAIASHLTAEVSVIGNTFIRRKVTIKKEGGKKVKKEKIQYCLRLGPHPVYVTKAQKPKEYKLPPVVVDPTYDELMEILEGE